MKRVLIFVLCGIAALVAAGSIVAARFEPTIEPNTFVGAVNVGGLSREEAAKKLRVWWEGVRTNKLTLKNPAFTKALPPMTPGQLGVTLDDQASVADLPMTELVQVVTQTFGSKPAPSKFEVKFKPVGAGLDRLEKDVRLAVGGVRPAKAVYVKGAIERKPEVASFELDSQALMAAVVAGLDSGQVDVPLKESAKHVPDEALAKIADVESEFSTRFPSYQTSRNTNIRLASQKLNGVVLMPGDQISFNQTVGERTVKGGFRVAPVLKNGRHDTGVGGGICQVSTTLYNAALLADLKIVRRNNHSIPSVYVPIGRDATVDWGTLDLVIGNSSDHPIAVSSSYENGRITFRILGQKDPSRKVKIVTDNLRSWDRGQDTVVDRSLPPGARRVVERGSTARSIDTYRIVYKDGVEVSREHLNHSTYGGSPRIVAFNPAAPAPKPAPKPQSPPPVAPPPPTPEPGG